MPTNDTKPDLALYIHWPFCRQKCPYCDFNLRQHDTGQRNLVRRSVPKCHIWPKHFDPGVDKQPLVGDAVLMPVFIAVSPTPKKLWLCSKSKCRRANPTSVETKVMKNFAIQVNRVSMGIQSLDRDILSF